MKRILASGWLSQCKCQLNIQQYWEKVNCMLGGSILKGIASIVIPLLHLHVDYSIQYQLIISKRNYHKAGENSEIIKWLGHQSYKEKQRCLKFLNLEKKRYGMRQDIIKVYKIMHGWR